MDTAPLKSYTEARPLLLDIFFYCFHDHRDLHSFPTRRSSDLVGSANGAEAVTIRDRSVVSSAATERSEEHTSELQSRLHLVCRLLLEKKKALPFVSTTICSRASPSRSTSSTPVASTSARSRPR